MDVIAIPQRELARRASLLRQNLEHPHFAGRPARRISLQAGPDPRHAEGQWHRRAVSLGVANYA
jgi:hypothetical protein